MPSLTLADNDIQNHDTVSTSVADLLGAGGGHDWLPCETELGRVAGPQKHERLYLHPSSRCEPSKPTDVSASVGVPTLPLSVVGPVSA